MDPPLPGLDGVLRRKRPLDHAARSEDAAGRGSPNHDGPGPYDDLPVLSRGAHPALRRSGRPRSAAPIRRGGPRDPPYSHGSLDASLHRLKHLVTASFQSGEALLSMKPTDL